MAETQIKLQGLAQIPAVRVYLSATVQITSGSNTKVAWTAEEFDTDTMHDNASNNTRITINKAGIYLVGYYVSFTSGGSGRRIGAIYKNNSPILSAQVEMLVNSGDNNALSHTTLLNLSASDYLEVDVYQSSGSNLNLLGGTGYNASSFWATRISR